jgi:hypothetical protein
VSVPFKFLSLDCKASSSQERWVRAKKWPKCNPQDRGSNMSAAITEKLYTDKLVEITGEALTFHNYYFWGCGKTVPVSEIEGIQGVPPGLNNGSWRIWGSSSFNGWMPMDWRRPSRDRIYLLNYKNKRFQIAFTVENSTLAESALKQLGLMKR